MPDLSNPSAANAATTDTEDATSEQSLLEVTLSGAIALAKDSKTHPQANAQFESLVKHVKNGSEAEREEITQLLKRLWKEYLAVQRSATFYASLSDAEKGLSDKMAESNIQLQRNYMRLVEEQ